MKIGYKLLLAFSGLTLLVGVVGFIGLYMSQRVLDAHEGGEEHFRSIVENAVAVTHAVKECETQQYLNAMLQHEPIDQEVASWQQDLKERVCLLEDWVKIPEAKDIVAEIESNVEKFLSSSAMLAKVYSEDIETLGKFDFERHKELAQELNDLSMNIREDAVKLARFETDFLNRQTTITAATEASSYARRTEGHLMLYLTLHDPIDRGKFFKRYHSLTDRIRVIEERVGTAEAEKMLQRMKKDSDNLFSAGVALLQAYDEELSKRGSFDPAAHEDLLSALENASHSAGKAGMDLAAHYVRLESVPRERARQSIAALQRTVLTVFSAAVFIALACGVGLSRTISESLRKLRDGTAAVRKGDLSTRMAITSRDEIGEVARSFDEMVEELAASRALILAAKQELEQRVEERTCELRTVNEQLIIDIEKRTRAERALRESEEYFRSLIEDASDMITVLNPNGTIRYCSPSVMRVLGYSPEEFLGRNAFEFIHPGDIPRVREVFEDMIKEPGVTHSAQYRFCHTDGECRTLESVGKPVVSPEGVIVIINSRDVTERIRAEESLRSSEERYRTLIESMNDGLGVVDDKGTITFVNESMCRMLGYTQEEALGRPALEFVDRAERDLFLAELAKRKEGVQHPYELRWRRKDGSTVLTIVSPRALYDSEGNYTGSFGIVTDITHLKEAEEALRRSEEKYRIVADNTYDWEFWMTPDEHFIYISPSCEKVSGYNAQEFIGDPSLIYRIVHPEDRHVFEAHRMKAAERRPCDETTFRIITAGGEVRWISHVCQPVFDRDGLFLGTRGTHRDITDRMVAEIALRASEQKYRSLMNDAGDAIFLADTEGNIVEANRKAAELTGYAREELLAMHVSDVIHEDHSEQGLHAFGEAASGGYTRVPEGAIRTKDGSKVIVDVVARLIEYGDTAVVQGILRDVTERKRAEEALRRSEARYRAIVEDQTELICRFLPDGTITFVNDAYCRYFGKTREDLLGSRFMPLIAEEDRPLVESHMQTLGHVQAAYSLEHRVIDGLGRLRWQRWFNRAIFDEKGEMIEVQSVGRDITGQRLAEEALRESEARYRQMFETNQAIKLLLDPETGAIVDGNDAACRFYGYTKDELTARKIYDINTLGKEESLAMMAKALAEDRLYFVFQHRLASGEIRDVEVYTGPVVLGGKKLLYSIVHDITARKQAEAALTESEHRFRMLVENLPQKIFLKDENSVYLYCNENFARDLGVPRESITGKTDHDLYPPRSAEKHIQEDSEVARSRKPLSTNERYEKGGREVIISVFKTPILDEDGQVRGILGIIWDITERVRLESIAEAVNTMENIGYVFSGIRHEIGNPINSLKITLSVLKSKADEYSKEMCMQYIDRAMGEIARIEYLLRALKTFNLYEVPEIQDINMCELLDKFLALVSGDCRKKGISVTTQCETDAEWGRADPRALQQVLLNVMVNAMDALEGRESPAVRIAVTGGDRVIRIRLTDNGIGMSEEQQRDLFKPFRTTKVKGTGLGLVIARKMLSRMNGTITVASRKGEGTTVEIVVPEGGRER